MGVEPQDENGWSEWRNLVLSELKDLKAGQQKFTGDLADYKEKTSAAIAALRVKSSAWGALGGAMVTTGAILLWLLTGKKP